MKLILEKSDVKGWRVVFGPEVKFVGGRVAAKKEIARLAVALGLQEWYNRKVDGKLVSVAI